VATYARIWGAPGRLPAVAVTGAAPAVSSHSPGASLLAVVLVALSAGPWVWPFWTGMEPQALGGAMLKSASVFAAGLMLHRLLSAPGDLPGAAPLGAPAWRPQLEGLDELLGAIVMLAAVLLGLLGWRP
jgi:hypothetical protein